MKRLRKLVVISEGGRVVGTQVLRGPSEQAPAVTAVLCPGPGQERHYLEVEMPARFGRVEMLRAAEREKSEESDELARALREVMRYRSTDMDWVDARTSRRTRFPKRPALMKLKSTRHGTKNSPEKPRCSIPKLESISHITSSGPRKNAYRNGVQITTSQRDSEATAGENCVESVQASISELIDEEAAGLLKHLIGNYAYPPPNRQHTAHGARERIRSVLLPPQN